jgi:hypothetical protein
LAVIRQTTRWEGDKLMFASVVRGALRRYAFLLAKGPQKKENSLRVNDRIWRLVDDEENFYRTRCCKQSADLQLAF